MYGKGAAMNLLASKGIDILNKHNDSLSNALHVAVQRKHLSVASMLIDSGFPLDEVNSLGHTALILCSSDKKSFSCCTKLVNAGADINHISNQGESALSETIIHEN